MLATAATKYHTTNKNTNFTSNKLIYSHKIIIQTFSSIPVNMLEIGVYKIQFTPYNNLIEMEWLFHLCYFVSYIINVNVISNDGIITKFKFYNTLVSFIKKTYANPNLLITIKLNNQNSEIFVLFKRRNNKEIVFGIIMIKACPG